MFSVFFLYRSLLVHPFVSFPANFSFCQQLYTAICCCTLLSLLCFMHRNDVLQCCRYIYNTVDVSTGWWGGCSNRIVKKKSENETGIDSTATLLHVFYIYNVILFLYSFCFSSVWSARKGMNEHSNTNNLRL